MHAKCSSGNTSYAPRPGDPPPPFPIELAPGCEHKGEDNWDFRKPPVDGKKRHKGGTRHILLVRHGQYDDQGALTPLGRKQATQTGKRLKQLCYRDNGITLKAVHCSSVLRARETFELIMAELPDDAQQLGKSPDNLLAEGCPCGENWLCLSCGASRC